jgi:hypothetical membrane protein
MILSGLLAGVFSFGLRRCIVPPSGRFGTLLLLLGSGALCGVGIFPEPMGYVHLVATVAFFVLMSMSFFYISGAAISAGLEKLGYGTFILGLIVFLCGGVMLLFGAIPELAAVLAIAAFSILYSIKMVKQAPQPVIGIPP